MTTPTWSKPREFSVLLVPDTRYNYLKHPDLENSLSWPQCKPLVAADSRSTDHRNYLHEFYNKKTKVNKIEKYYKLQTTLCQIQKQILQIHIVQLL